MTVRTLDSLRGCHYALPLPRVLILALIAARCVVPTVRRRAVAEKLERAATDQRVRIVRVGGMPF